MFFLTYRKPATLVIALMGIINLAICGVYYSGRHILTSPPYFQLVFGIALVGLIPLSIYMSAKKRYNSSRLLQSEVEYEFTDTTMKMTGPAINAQRDIDSIYKTEETNYWILIYESEKMANILPKKCMTQAEIEQLRQIVGRIGR